MKTVFYALLFTVLPFLSQSGKSAEEVKFNLVSTIPIEKADFSVPIGINSWWTRYGRFVEKKMILKGRQIYFFIISRNSIMYFDESGALIDKRILPHPENIRTVSQNGKYILITNYQIQQSRMEMFDGKLLWEKRINRLTSPGNLIGSPPGKITPNGNLILEIPCCRCGSPDFTFTELPSNLDPNYGKECPNEKIVIYDSRGNMEEIGNITAKERFSPGGFVGNISPAGKFYAINCVRKTNYNGLENVIALYDLDKKTELWRYKSNSRRVGRIFVTNDGQVATYCNVYNKTDMYNLVFFNESGEIVKSYPNTKSILFASPDAEYLVCDEDNKQLLIETSTGDIIWQYSDMKVKALSNNGEYAIAISKDNHLCTIEKSGEIMYQGKRDPWCKIVMSGGGSSLLIINYWQTKVYYYKVNNLY